MLHSTASKFSLTASRQTHLPQPTQQSPTQRKAIKSGDSVYFGASDTSTAPKTESFLHTTPVVKNLYASLKGGFKGAFGGPWHNYFGGAALLFAVTLPLALFIPGSHFILLPAYVGARRAISGVKGLITGLTNPDEILNPKTEK